MATRKTRKRGVVSRGIRGLSLLAVCGLIIGAVFLLTSNQGCMRLIGGRQSSASAPGAVPQSKAQQKAQRTAEKPESQASQPPKQKPDNSKPERVDSKDGQKPVADDTQTAVDNAQPSADNETASTAPKAKRQSGPDPLKNMRTSSGMTSYGEVSRGSTKSRRIAITLDAGASAVPTDKILKVLAKHHLHCTFFLTGKWLEQNPGLARRIISEGHEIGNHTYSHPRLTQLSDREIGKQIERTEQLAQRITGVSTKPLFRPPYGARDRHVLSTIGGLGYRSIYWHVDCWDSVKVGITPEQITKRVLNLVGNGSIVLMHCGSQATADAMDGLLTQLEARGYQPVTVSELLGAN